MQKILLIGNIGKDVEMKTLGSGSKYCRVPLAVSENYTNKAGEKIENLEWFNLVIWNKLAEVFEKWVKKGDKIFVQCKMKTSISEKDGKKNYFTDFIVTEMEMLGGKKEGGRPEPTEPDKAQYVVNKAIPEGEDDLPF